MENVLNKNSMRVSRNPEFFIPGLMKPGKKKPLGVADLSFFDQITGKYRHAVSFIKTQLYYLYFPKQVKSLKKNLSINFFIHSRFNIFPAIVKNIGYFHLNFIENKQEDIFLTKISYLSKAPPGFNLPSQPVFYFQNIATCAVKKLIKINYKNAKDQKHETRPENQVANIFFRDTSFFTYPRLNPISNRADRNIVEKKSKSTQNFVISEVTVPEKINIQISHPSRRPSLINSYLQNLRNRITIPPVLLNVPVHGHIFAKRSAAGRQARSDWINHISPASESDTGILFVSDFLRNGRNRLKFYEKQSDQRSRRYGGMELVILPYTGVHNRVKSFVKPGITKLSPVVPSFLRMEVSNKSNVEQRISGFPEKDLSYYLSISRTHHITTIANFFRHTDVHNRVKPFFKPYLTKFPVTIMSQRKDIFNLHNNITNKKQLNISKEKITQPIPLIPSLPATFSNLPVMHGNPLLEAKDANSHTKKRARKQPVESDTAHLNIMKSINFDKQSINRMRHIPFSDYNFTYRFPDKANKDFRCVIGRQRTIAFPKSLSENLYMMKQRYMLRKSGSVKTINNPPSPEKRKNMREEIGRRGSISTQEPSMAGYRNNFPDMTYFSSNRSPHSTDMAGRSEERKRTEFLKVDSSYKTDYTKLLSVPGPDLYGLADKVYGLIVERIKRERELRGR